MRYSEGKPRSNREQRTGFHDLGKDLWNHECRGRVDGGRSRRGRAWGLCSMRRAREASGRRQYARSSNSCHRTVERVGVFVNQFEDSICNVADEAGLTAVQLHGDNEDPYVADLIAIAPAPAQDRGRYFDASPQTRGLGHRRRNPEVASRSPRGFWWLFKTRRHRRKVRLANGADKN